MDTTWHGAKCVKIPTFFSILYRVYAEKGMFVSPASHVRSFRGSSACIAVMLSASTDVYHLCSAGSAGNIQTVALHGTGELDHRGRKSLPSETSTVPVCGVWSRRRSHSGLNVAV